MGQLLSQVTEEAGGEGPCCCVDSCNAVSGSHHEVGGTIGVADVFINKVPQLMTYDGKHLVVVHGIHQAGIDAHTAIATGEGVDRVGLIHLVVQVQITDVVEPRHDAAQTLRIAVVGRQNGVLSIGFNHVLTAQLLDLCIADGQGLNGSGTRVDG